MSKTATQGLEEQYAERAAKELSDEIDAEILFDLMVEFGWTRVKLSTLSFSVSKDINTWMHAECKLHWKQRGKVWIFESREEAALFKLTWGN